MTNRAYSVLTVKAIDEDLRIIEGTASTPSTDRMGDVIDPLGARFARRADGSPNVPIKFQHGKDPFVGDIGVGYMLSATPSSDAIPVRFQIAKSTEPGRLKDVLDYVWQSLKMQLVGGLSIGFNALVADPIKGTFGLRFKEWEWLELSTVTIPANSQASISLIKSIATHDLAAFGTGQGDDARPLAGVSARVVKAQKGLTAMKTTIQEQISSFEATRQAKDADRTAIMTKAADVNETLDAKQAETYDTLTSEIESVDAHLKRLRLLETSNVAAAVEVKGANLQDAARSRSTTSVISVRNTRPAGIGLARVAIAKMASRLEGCTVMEVVKQRWPDDSELAAFFTKAAVPAGTTTNAPWMGNLVETSNLPGEFLAFVRPQTILGRIPNLRNVPFNVRVTGQSTGAVANWVGQGKAKPVTSFSTTSTTLLYTKIAAIAVITEELARFSSPSAEALVRDELARAVIERMDVDFIDPASAAVTNVQPASITNGVTPLSSAGTSADNIRTDLINLLSSFIDANVDPSGLVLIMPNSLALAASLMVNSLGQPEFAGLGIKGGTLQGIPVITSQYAANQSGSGNLVIAVNAPDIFLADDGQVTLDASREASIEMSDAPTQDSTVPTASTSVSMYQTNSIAIRAERYINWAKARTNAVAFIDDVNWGSVGSPS